MELKKLNFGCGSRFVQSWVNIDFTSSSPQVKAINFLKGFPFADNSFDVVYSSHVLEHFTIGQAKALLLEAYRVLKPGGILRVVVPDLENICREYLRVLSLPDSDKHKSQYYQWIIIELLDQMARMTPGGEMVKMFQAAKGNDGLRNYIHQRTSSFAETTYDHVSFYKKLRTMKA